MAAIGDSSKAAFKWLDHSGEGSRTQLHFEALDDSGDNSAIIGAAGAISLMFAAIQLISNLETSGVNVTLPLFTTAASLPTGANAQREIAIRWSYADTVTGKKYRFDTPAPVDAIIPTGTDEVNMASVAVLAFKAVFDANVVSEFGNPVVLQTGRYVGRRS